MSQRPTATPELLSSEFHLLPKDRHNCDEDHGISDQVIKESEDFLSKCAAHGILYKYNPDHKIDLKFMLAEQKERNPRSKFTRSRTLGWFYETEQIKSRIAQYQGCMIYVPRTKIKVVTPKVEENRFVCDAIDQGNMQVASVAKNIIAEYGL